MRRRWHLPARSHTECGRRQPLHHGRLRPGQRSNEYSASAGSSCSDNNACNGAEICDGLGTCVAGTPLQVDDANLCTEDACDPVNGVTHLPVTAVMACHDQDPCTHDDHCDGSGQCTGTRITCASEDCVSRWCDGTSVCQVAYTTNSCDDGNACSLGDRCDGAGACVGTASCSA
jgi:hypothetical protein